MQTRKQSFKTFKTFFGIDFKIVWQNFNIVLAPYFGKWASL